MRRVKLSASLANQYDPPARAMQITMVMYDSPSSHKDAPEVNDGEYVVLLNTSNDTLNLGAYRLRNLLTNDNWTMTGMGSVAPGQRIMLANYPSGGAASFKTLSLVTDQDLAEGDIRLADSLGISLWDSAGAIVIEDTFGILHDRMNYGEYFGLDARNSYVATASLGTLGDREPMQAVYRTAGLSRPVGGTTPQVWVITTTGTMAGEVSLSPLPEGYSGSETGTYALERGGTAYEFTNHLGNVLAVVSDKKLGQGGTTLEPTSTYYHPHTAMLTDYYPFGSPMVGRTWQSGWYRYGFQGQEGDDEVVGEGNAYAYTYRMSDSRLGRFWSVDPLFSYFPHLGPYSFGENDVLRAVELEGREKLIVHSPYYSKELRKAFSSNDMERVTELVNCMVKQQVFPDNYWVEKATLKDHSLFSIDYSMTDEFQIVGGNGGWDENNNLVFVKDYEVLYRRKIRLPSQEEEPTLWERFKRWDEGLAQPGNGIPFGLTVMGMVASAGTLLPEAGATWAAANGITWAGRTFTVVSMGYSVNSLSLDENGDTWLSKYFQKQGIPAEESRMLVSVGSIVSNLGSIGGSAGSMLKGNLIFNGPSAGNGGNTIRKDINDIDKQLNEVERRVGNE